MEHATHALLAGWANFYVIVGSSAGALTGLQFVVMTLIADARHVPGSMHEIRAFGTPTVVHFCTALLISAVMNMPWRALPNLGFCLAGCGVAGIAYAIATIWHARRSAYTPDVEDWTWYAALPLVAYAALLTAGILLWWKPTASLFMTAATTLLLLFIGIHNAWDTVTYITMQRKQEPRDAERTDQSDT